LIWVVCRAWLRKLPGNPEPGWQGMPVDEPKPASWQFHWHESSFVTSPYLRFIHLRSHTFSFLCFGCRIEQSSQEQRKKQICSAAKLCVGSGEIGIWNGLPHISGVLRDLVELLNPRREVDSSDACAWAGEGAKKYFITTTTTSGDKARNPDSPSNPRLHQITLLRTAAVFRSSCWQPASAASTSHCDCRISHRDTSACTDKLFPLAIGSACAPRQDGVYSVWKLPCK
jgi:hypothetical protein